MKIFNKLKFFLFFSLIPIQLAFASSAPQELSHLLNHLRGLRANFTQTLTDDKNQTLQVTRGQMILKRPGKFRWEVIQPNKQLLIADGKKVWFYDVGLKQIMIQNQQTIDKNSPAILLSDSPKNLTKNFKIEYLMDVQGFYLIAKEKSALFRVITLIFKKNHLSQMRMTDKLNQETVIDFSRVNNNPIIDPQAFRFVYPKDKNVEIVKD